MKDKNQPNYTTELELLRDKMIESENFAEACILSALMGAIEEGQQLELATLVSRFAQSRINSKNSRLN